MTHERSDLKGCPLSGRLIERGNGDFERAGIYAQALVQSFERCLFCRPNRRDDEIVSGGGGCAYARLLVRREIVAHKRVLTRLDPFQIGAHGGSVSCRAHAAGAGAQRAFVGMADGEIPSKSGNCRALLIVQVVDVRRAVNVVEDFECGARNDLLRLKEHERLKQAFCRPTTEQPFRAAFFKTERGVFFQLCRAQKGFRRFLHISYGFKQPVCHGGFSLRGGTFGQEHQTFHPHGVIVQKSLCRAGGRCDNRTV